MKTIEDIMNLIDLQAEVRQLVIKAAMKLDFDEFEYDILKLTYIESAPGARNSLKERLEPDDGNIKLLACFLYAARFTYEKYQELFISEKIYVDTLKALTRFINEHYISYDKWAFDRDWWAYRQLSLTLFRIGVLEYEMKEKDNEKYISIHIPSDADIKPEKVRASLIEARAFFKVYYPEFKDVSYSCSSWLLSSDLDNVLPPTSNIIKFKCLFNIISESYPNTGFIKWIYKGEYSNLVDLPEDTTLQRNLKTYLLEGNSVSVAYGIIDFNRL